MKKTVVIITLITASIWIMRYFYLKVNSSINSVENNKVEQSSRFFNEVFSTKSKNDDLDTNLHTNISNDPQANSDSYKLTTSDISFLDDFKGLDNSSSHDQIKFIQKSILDVKNTNEKLIPIKMISVVKDKNLAKSVLLELLKSQINKVNYKSL